MKSLDTYIKENYPERYKQLYIEKDGPIEGLRRVAEINYPSWMAEVYPRYATCPIKLTAEDCRYLGNVWRELGRDYTMIPALLSQGERESRWELPAKEGILTQDYWADEFGIAIEM